MGLLKLLSVNQTFTSVRSVHSPYHVTQQNWLPRFGMADISELTLAEKENMKTALPIEPIAGPFQAASAESSGEEKMARPVKGRWLSSHYPQKANRPLRQAELCLESVKVIRNDLKDSDIEIVPMHARRAARVEPNDHGTPDLFRQAAQARHALGVFGTVEKKPAAAVLAQTAGALKQAGEAAHGSELHMAAASAKSTGYLGLSMLHRWFGLGRRRG